MKKYFLSSMLVMGLMAPAFGADGKITGGAGTCTVDVLGVYDNNATANTIATWALNDYKCGAGQYLDEDTLACITCPTGSYCPGGTYTVENADEGTNACPTGYQNSDAGASADTQCYTVCTVANANIEHATAVSGNDYYGTTDADTCTATNCELGYHVEMGEIELVEKTPLIPVNYEMAGTDYGYISSDGTASNATENGLLANNTWAANFDYGRVYGKASCQATQPVYDYIMENADAIENGTMTMEELQAGLTQVVGPTEAKLFMDYLLMRISGFESMTEEERFKTFAKYFVSFSELSDKNYATDSTGQYCYCQLDGFSPMTDGVLGKKTNVTYAPWVLLRYQGSAESCASGCARDCSVALWSSAVGDRAFRAAVYGTLDAVEVGGGMCKVTETDCPAGQYLAVVGDAMMCVPCKSGSYCPGGVYTIESEYKGTELCPSGYPNSDAGAGADTQCYKACTLETANIAHATAVSGNDYYGAGTDTCTATACATGYHTDAKIQFVEKTPVVNVDLNSINGVAVIDGTGWTFNENLPNSGLTENNTIAVSFSNGIMYGRASCQPEADAGAVYLTNNMNAVMDGSMSVEDFRSGMTAIAGAAKAEVAVEYLNALKSGNMTEEEMTKRLAVFLISKNANYSTSSTGQYCYFQVNGFAPSGGTKSDIGGLPWVMGSDVPYSSAEDCASNCIMDGAELVLYFAPVALGALDYAEISTCAANTINIDWNPDNGGDHTQNMCLYDGAITLPTPDPVKPGYVFSGWKLVE